MSYSNRFSVFQTMNEKPKVAVAVAATAAPAYKSWKNKEVTAEGKVIPKIVNISSVTDFPELVKGDVKKSIFEGTSLASKLKDVIAAEEEAAILKRIKKGETPEDIFRESCTVLPLKQKMLDAPKEFVAPWWVTDTTVPLYVPIRISSKTPAQIKQERLYKRYGIQTVSTVLFDDEDEEDTVSLPPMQEEEMEEPYDMDQFIEAS